ncbi:MAG: hypothetical protein QW735_02385 [archaeon]
MDEISFEIPKPTQKKKKRKKKFPDQLIPAEDLVSWEPGPIEQS